MSPRRALLITYHFPPSAAAGAQRWEVFTRAAAERGWTFDVLSGAGESSQPSDAVRVFAVPEARHWLNRLSDVVVGLKNRRRRGQALKAAGGSTSVAIEPQVVRRQDIRFPRTPTDFRRNLRALLRYTDALPWMHSAAAVALPLVARNRYDVVIASGPPHVSAEAARVAAAAAGVPLVLDFRDPWSLIDIVQEECASWTFLRLATRLERKVVGAASLLVMNTPRAAQAMRTAYPQTEIIAVPNGFNGERPRARHPEGKFIAMYAGTIYLDRDPRPLLAALARITPELELSPDNFVIRFVGRELEYGGQSPEQLAAAAGLPPGLVESQAVLPRQQLFKDMETVALLVNLPQGERQCVPSKVYEYLHFPAWVLGLEPSGTATHDVLSSVAADIAEPNDVDAIARLLRARIVAFRAGDRPQPLAESHQYYAPQSAEQFFDAVEAKLRAP